MTRKVLYREEEITNKKKNKTFILEPYKNTHQHEYSTHGSENEIPTAVYIKSKVFKNDQLKCQQFYYECPKEVTLKKNIYTK